MTHLLPRLMAGLVLLLALLPHPVAGAMLLPAVPVQGAAVTHVVVPGDTLFSIAGRYNTTVAALMEANGLTNSVIRVGQTLRIDSSSPPSSDTVHTVVAGDTLFSIARRYGSTVDAIKQANHLTGTNIYVGQRLVIPSPSGPSGTTIHTVVRGDTLFSIARHYGTTVDAIRQANHLTGTNIYVGQRLQIPQTAIAPTPRPGPMQTRTPVTTLNPTPTGTFRATQTPTTTVVPTPTRTPTPTPTLIPGSGFGDGTYVVGQNVQPGTYRSSAIGTCYWARLSGFSGEIDDIIVNGLRSPEIVTISAGDAGFETRGCGQWIPVEATAPTSPATQFGDGTYVVGMHIAPGTYQANGSGTCYWARLSDFSQEISGIIAVGNDTTVITIEPSDAGFTTFGCGTWSQ